MYVMIILYMRKLMYFNKFIVKSKCYALLCFSASHFYKGGGGWYCHDKSGLTLNVDYC